MKIISPFHDYYDTALSFGADPDTRYVRETRVESGVDIEKLKMDMLPWNASAGKGWNAGIKTLVIIDKNIIPGAKLWHSNRIEILFDEVFILIAGKAYPIWLKKDAGSYAALGGDVSSKNETLGSPSDEELIKNAQASYPKSNFVSKVKMEYQYRKNDEKLYSAAREKFLERDFTDLHIELGAPILMIANTATLWERTRAPTHIEKQIGGGRRCTTAIVANPQLLSLGMFRLIDPATTFQAIAQFINGVAPGQQMPMITLKDSDMVIKKGFDPKYGFRTRPGK